MSETLERRIRFWVMLGGAAGALTCAAGTFVVLPDRLERLTVKVEENTEQINNLREQFGRVDERTRWQLGKGEGE